MASYATLCLEDGRPICHFRNGVDSLFFRLFTRADWVELHGEEAYPIARHSYYDIHPSEAHLLGFRISSHELRDRLDIMGVNLDSTKKLLGNIIEEGEAFSRECAMRSSTQELATEYATQIERWATLSVDSWFAELKERIDAGEPVDRSGSRDLQSASWLMAVWKITTQDFR